MSQAKRHGDMCNAGCDFAGFPRMEAQNWHFSSFVYQFDTID